MLWRLFAGRIYSLIAKNLEFDLPIQVTWKRRGTGNHINLIKRKYSRFKSNKLSSCCPLLFLFVLVVYLHKTDIIVFRRVIIYSYLQNFFKIGVLKTFAKFTGKHVSECFFNKPPSWYFLSKKLRHRCFLVNLANCGEHYFYRIPLDFCICIYETYMWYHKT